MLKRVAVFLGLVLLMVIAPSVAVSISRAVLEAIVHSLQGMLAGGPPCLTTSTTRSRRRRWSSKPRRRCGRPTTDLAPVPTADPAACDPAHRSNPALQLGAEHLQLLYAELVRRGLTPATVVQLHRILHNALGQAARWDLVGRNVADPVKPPRAPRYEFTTLSPEQARQFLDATRGDRLKALYVLAITTGMRLGERLGELLRLRWREVDLETRVLSIRGARPGEAGAGPKTQRSRRPVVLTEVAAAALRRHRAAQAAERIRAGGVAGPRSHIRQHRRGAGEPLQSPAPQVPSSAGAGRTPPPCASTTFGTARQRCCLGWVPIRRS